MSAFETAAAGGIVDTAVGLPRSREEMLEFYEFIRAQTRDAESRRAEGGLEFPAGYMFKDPVHFEADELGDDPVEFLIREHDRFGITQALLNVDGGGDGARAVREHPDRFFAALAVDPNSGMEAVRRIEHFHEEHHLHAVGIFGAGLVPQVAFNDKKLYPVYAKCVELDIAFCATAGVPGPRIPFAPQDVALIDEVCWYFPELRFVMRHGAEPWADLAVKLMLKWPNLYYSTTAFAPKYYPREVLDFANTRGADKLIWSGYFPAGLTYDRIFEELPAVPLRDHVWPRFLRENARRVFRLDPGAP